MAQTYSIEFKEEACKRVQSGIPAAQVARELGINVNTLYTWMSRFKEHPAQPFVGSGNLHQEDAELRALKKRIKDLEEENEFLKKASAFFAKNLKLSVTFIWSSTAPNIGSQRWRSGFRFQKAVIMRGGSAPKTDDVQRMNLY